MGAEVSAHFDSMLVKLTCRARTFPLAVRRARRALAEFRVRGVATNLPFLEAVLADPDYPYQPEVLADLAVTDPAAFTALVEVARKALPADVNAPAA